ncbi:hypothetical protein [Clostridium gasigenes]|uniref:hypothetical protein n=1 Tax=Clostridium gasigenes TaxID=94869 RepID=UPI001C0CB79E|nr:hypothetical protein [Clostridium gasigenes]MBU3102947.1 hypothetical protein [Clostridium gasigenes]
MEDINKIILEHTKVALKCSEYMTKYRIASFTGETEESERYFKLVEKCLEEIDVLRKKRDLILNKK